MSVLPLATPSVDNYPCRCGDPGECSQARDSDDDIRHAVENSLAGGRSDDQTDLVMLVGPDQSGNLIEAGIVVTDDIEYAIHAMRARHQYLEWL